MPLPPPFPPDELATLENTAFFLQKDAATARIHASLDVLRERLRAVLAAGADGWLCAGAMDVEQGQLTTGESYRGLPYVVLDFPKRFSRAEFLTMRTLFWWGHYAVYALMVQGPWLAEAVGRIEAALPALTAAGVEATLADTPWDWQRGPGYTRPLLDDADTREWLRAAPFLKLMRFLPLAADTFTPERLVEMGIESWRLYAPLVSGAQP